MQVSSRLDQQAQQSARNSSQNELVSSEAPYATIKELAEIYGMQTTTVRQRLAKHWHLEQALTSPVNGASE